MAGNARLVKAYSSTVVALNGVTAGTVTSAAALVLQPLGANNIKGEALVANVSVAITTTALTVTTKWQVSNNGTTWTDLLPHNGAAYVQTAPAGTGALVTTTYAQMCQIDVSYPYVRLAVLSAGATGAAGDNVTISYNWKRDFVFSG